MRKVTKYAVKGLPVTVFIAGHQDQVGAQGVSLPALHPHTNSSLYGGRGTLREYGTVNDGKRYLRGGLVARIISVSRHYRPLRTPQDDAPRHRLSRFPMCSNINDRSRSRTLSKPTVVNNHIAYTGGVA
jgi:hypothetical protein